jgi:hypothetical protein
MLIIKCSKSCMSIIENNVSDVATWFKIEFMKISRYVVEIKNVVEFMVSFFDDSRLRWPSNWVEPELGLPTLGLARVGHTLLARAGRTGWGFCPNGSNELRFLSGRITRARTFVRRIESNRHTCPSSTQLEFRPIQKSRIGLSNRGLNSQFYPTG